MSRRPMPSFSPLTLAALSALAFCLLILGAWVLLLRLVERLDPRGGR